MNRSLYKMMQGNILETYQSQTQQRGCCKWCHDCHDEALAIICLCRRWLRLLCLCEGVLNYFVWLFCPTFSNLKCCKLNCSIYMRMHEQPSHKCTTPRKGITSPSMSYGDGGRYSPKVAPCYHVYCFAIELTFVVLFQMLLDNQLCDLSSTNPCGTTRFMGTLSPPFSLPFFLELQTR
jgi:hypothetical protein